MPCGKVFSHLSRWCMLFSKDAMWYILPWCFFLIKIRLSLRILLNCTIWGLSNTFEVCIWTGFTNWKPLENVFCWLFRKLYFRTLIRAQKASAVWVLLLVRPYLGLKYCLYFSTSTTGKTFSSSQLFSFHCMKKGLMLILQTLHTAALSFNSSSPVLLRVAKGKTVTRPLFTLNFSFRSAQHREYR